MEAYVRQKRAQPGMVLASDVPASLMVRPGTATSAKLVQSPQSPHAYDGPLQFTMSAHNPDQVRSMSPDNDGELFSRMDMFSIFLLCFGFCMYFLCIKSVSSQFICKIYIRVAYNMLSGNINALHLCLNTIGLRFTFVNHTRGIREFKYV